MKTLTKEIKNKLFDYFLTHINLSKSVNGWYRGDCPICNRVYTFGVNIERNKTNCFGCKYQSSLIHLVKELENLDDYHKAWEKIKVFDGIEFDSSTSHKRTEEPNVINTISLPEEFIPINIRLKNSKLSNLALDYWKSRNFDLDQSAYLGIGYCTKGEFRYRIIIPYFYNNKLVYYTARQFVNYGPKFKNIDSEKALGKSFLIYNRDALYLYSHIYLLESATNAITLGDNAIALGGKFLHEYQKYEILKSPCKRVTIILDPDAFNESIQLALSLIPHKEVRIIQLPKFGDDVNKLGKKETLKICRQNKEYHSSIHKIKQIKNIHENTINPYGFKFF